MIRRWTYIYHLLLVESTMYHRIFEISREGSVVAKPRLKLQVGLLKVELEVLSYRQTDTVISVYMVRYRYIINNQVKTG